MRSWNNAVSWCLYLLELLLYVCFRYFFKLALAFLFSHYCTFNLPSYSVPHGFCDFGMLQMSQGFFSSAAVFCFLVSLFPITNSQLPALTVVLQWPCSGKHWKCCPLHFWACVAPCRHLGLALWHLCLCRVVEPGGAEALWELLSLTLWKSFSALPG